jgi:hypothetical protein
MCRSLLRQKSSDDHTDNGPRTGGDGDRKTVMLSCSVRPRLARRCHSHVHPEVCGGFAKASAPATCLNGTRSLESSGEEPTTDTNTSAATVAIGALVSYFAGSLFLLRRTKGRR